MDIKFSGADVIKIATLISAMGVAWGSYTTQQKEIHEMVKKHDAEILRLTNKVVVLEVREENHFKIAKIEDINY